MAAHPVRLLSTSNPWLLTGVALIAVVVLGLFGFALWRVGLADAESRALENQAFHVCQDHVARRLGNPQNASFASKTDRTIERTGPQTFRVASSVDLRDRAGAAARKGFQCRVTLHDGEWTDAANWSLDDLVLQ